ncbi:MAG: hypothetical protein ACQETL_19835 [Bacteroidota bacterium]
MADINENLKGAFGDSLKNKFDEYSDYDSDLEIDAIFEAKKLNEYVRTEKMEKLNHRTLLIHSQSGNDYRFQATQVRFLRPNGESCKAEFSVPIDFNGPIRLWAEDLRGKKVWSTMDKIEEWECNPDLLFDFLGKYTHRFTEQEMADDLPF